IAASEKQGSGPAWLPKIEGHNTPFLELEESELSFENNQKLKSNTIVTSEILPSHSHNEHVIENPNSVSQQTLKQSIASESITQMEIVPKDNELEIHTKNIENTSIELPTKVELENLQPSIQQPLSQIKPSPTNESTYQPQKRISRIEGGISNRGKSSVSAVGTPLGKYKKALTDAIGSRWYFYIKQNLSLMTVGTAIIRFYVMPSGKVSGVKVLSNTSSESFASVSIRAIVDAEIPPMPPEVAELLENNRIEVDYTFSIFSN
ncbi:MAG: hypothetical protein NZL93_01040, partial [Chthoniobacterales bacterium]|nr:hypothetical protein [Chthoniobacterales bacterium]